MFRSSFKDKEGNLWFGTSGAGLYKWDGKLFTRFAEESGLKDMIICSIAQDKEGRMWLATDVGVFYSDKGKFSELPFATEVNNQFIQTNSSNTKKTQAYCILCDRNGNIWFCTENKGLWKYDGKSLKQFTSSGNSWVENSTNNQLSNKRSGLIQSLLEDHKGNIWVSAIGAPLCYYDGSTFHSLYDEFQKTTDKNKQGINMTSGHIFQMLEDRNGNIWMATRDNGICRYNGKIIERFAEKDGVDDNGAICMYEDKEGNIWFGSLGIAGSNGNGKRGLIMYNGKTFRRIPTDKMDNNQVWTIIRDNSQAMWIGTKEFGLYRYDGSSFTKLSQQ